MGLCAESCKQGGVSVHAEDELGSRDVVDAVFSSLPTGLFDVGELNEMLSTDALREEEETIIALSFVLRILRDFVVGPGDRQRQAVRHGPRLAQLRFVGHLSNRDGADAKVYRTVAFHLNFDFFY